MHVSAVPNEWIGPTAGIANDLELGSGSDALFLHSGHLPILGGSIFVRGTGHNTVPWPIINRVYPLTSLN